MTDTTERLRAKVDTALSRKDGKPLNGLERDELEALDRAITPTAPHMGVGREEIARALYKSRNNSNDQYINYLFSQFDHPQLDADYRRELEHCYRDADAILSLPVQGTWRTPEGWREALEWYGEQARLCRLIHSEGDAGREALAADGGNRARAALAAEQARAVSIHKREDEQ